MYFHASLVRGITKLEPRPSDHGIRTERGKAQGQKTKTHENAIIFSMFALDRSPVPMV